MSGGVTRLLKSGASARFLGRGEFGRTGTPGATAFGYTDMDAFFRHRDGSVLGGWNQPLGSRVTQQASYSYIITKYRSTNLRSSPMGRRIFPSIPTIRKPSSSATTSSIALTQWWHGTRR